MRSIIILLAIAISCLSIGITIGQHTASCYVVVPPVNTSAVPLASGDSNENAVAIETPPCKPLGSRNTIYYGTCDPIPQ